MAKVLTAFMAGTAFCIAGGCTLLRSGPEQPSQPPAPAQPPVTFELRVSGLPADGMWKCDPALVDINDDGLADLAALPRLGWGPRVWLASRDGSWSNASVGLRTKRRSCGGGVDFGDVNGDGLVDLVVGDHCQGLFVYLRDGSHGWTEGAASLHPGLVEPGDPDASLYVGAEDVTLGDVNGDGFADMVAGASDHGGMNLYLGDGTGTGWTWVPTPFSSATSNWANRVLLVDVNQDGRLDLVASAGQGPRVWVQDDEAGWKLESRGLPSPIVNGLYGAIAAADLNADGRTDLATANWIDGPEVYLQMDDGSWHKTPDVFPQMLGGATGLSIGDFNKDGWPDLVVSGRLARTGGCVRGVFLLMGLGDGKWRYVANSGLPSTGLLATPGVAVGDVDGDGSLDVAASSGLIVETVPGANAPSIPQRVLVWKGHPTR
ncbi:MAG: FG-GAP repeat domain-containing protein [Phycisphaerae bacterium]